MSALTPASLISIMMRAGASAEEIAEAVAQLLQARSAPGASGGGGAAASSALPSAGGGGAAASRALPSAGALAAKCELLAAERDRLKLIADKAEAKRLKDNARGRAKTRDAAAYRQQQEAEEAKKAEVLKLSGDLVYMTQTGNVYEWDADAEVRGDYVGRLVKDEFDTLSIDYDAVEVV